MVAVTACQPRAVLGRSGTLKPASASVAGDRPSFDPLAGAMDRCLAPAPPAPALGVSQPRLPARGRTGGAVQPLQRVVALGSQGGGATQGGGSRRSGVHTHGGRHQRRASGRSASQAQRQPLAGSPGGLLPSSQPPESRLPGRNASPPAAVPTPGGPGRSDGAPVTRLSAATLEAASVSQSPASAAAASSAPGPHAAAPAVVDAHTLLSTPLPEHPLLVRGVLPNGLRYCVLPNGVPSGRIEAHLEMHVGSVDEAENEQGLAHLVEHVTFLGSPKRDRLLGASPPKQRGQRGLGNEGDWIGGGAQQWLFLGGSVAAPYKGMGRRLHSVQCPPFA
jgi:hypothetical protein